MDANVRTVVKEARAGFAVGLRLEGAPLALLFDTLPDGVWIADPHGTLVYTNHAGKALLGLPDEAPAAAVADRLERLCAVPGQPVPPEERPLARALRGEAGAGIALLLQLPDGEDVLHLRLSFAPLRLPDGNPGGAILYAGDRTAQYRIERARDDFLASVAHDLRSPLTAIRGSAQLAARWLQRADLDREPLGRSLRNIDAAAARLNRMLETLMDSARLERGGLVLQCVPTDLVALVREVVDHYERESRRHRFVVAVPEGPLIGEWDAALLERAVENLIGNAVKYSPDGGEIVVACSDEGEEIRFSVRDQGIGIPPAALPHIFDRFYRARNADFGEIEGNGLGLFTVKGIVTSHGGSISVQSAEGQGTEMIVHLPRQAECGE